MLGEWEMMNMKGLDGVGLGGVGNLRGIEVEKVVGGKKGWVK